MTAVAVTPRSFRATEGRHLDLLRSSGLDVRFPSPGRHLVEEEMRALVRGCDGIIVGVDPVTDAVLAAGPLRVVVKYGSGMDNIDLEAARRREVRVADTHGENARSVAELALGLLLALARRVVVHDRRIRDGAWSRDSGVELAGKRLGLVGYGAVGREVGRLAACLGMEVVATDPYARDAGIPLTGLDELLASSDAVSLHAPLTDATRGMIGKLQLAAMRPGALLVNTARGGLVDEDALVGALREGRLGGAAFDSFAAEPATASPLLGVETFVASPHAGASTVEATRRAGEAAVRRLLELLGEGT